MTDQQFCKIESEYSGEHIDKVEQLQMETFSGRELKKYIEFFVKELKPKRSIRFKVLCYNQFNINHYTGPYHNRLTIMIFRRAIIITY